jgi:hypothetical protein
MQFHLDVLINVVYFYVILSSAALIVKNWRHSIANDLVSRQSEEYLVASPI